MNELIEYTSGEKKVPFFRKPGSVTGTILLVLGGAFALFHINSILVFLNSLLANTLTFVGLCAALAAIVYCILDPKIRRIVSELYFMLVRKVMGIVVEMYPIAIVQHHIERMKEKIREIQKNMGSLEGLIKESENQLNIKKRQIEHDALALKKCTEKNKFSEAQVYERQVVRLDESIKRREKRLDEARKWYKILSDLKYEAQLTVKDTENEINERVEEWNMIKKQHKVFTSVMGILQDNDQFNTFTMAMDYMSMDITQKLGEMESIINETGNIMTKMNLENEITSEKASALMEKYDKYGIDGLLGRVNNKTIENKSDKYVKVSDFSFTEREKVKINQTITNNNQKAITSEWFDD